MVRTQKARCRGRGSSRGQGIFMAANLGSRRRTRTLSAIMRPRRRDLAVDDAGTLPSTTGRSCQPGYAPGRRPHVVEHRLRQRPGERVLLARMVRREQRGETLEWYLDAVAEARTRTRDGRATISQHAQHMGERHAAEDDDDAYVLEEVQLGLQPRAA